MKNTFNLMLLTCLMSANHFSWAMQQQRTINALLPSGETQLTAALLGDNPDKVLEKIKALVEKEGADVNAKNVDGYTPLMLAVRFDASPEPILAEYLLAHGANPAATNNSGKTAAQLVNVFHHRAHQQLLYDKLLAQWSQRTKEAKTEPSKPAPIIAPPAAMPAPQAKPAALTPTPTVPATGINALLPNGETQLTAALLGDNPDRVLEKIKTLVEKEGADVNAKNADGYTPLMLAVRFNPDAESKIVEYLLKRGADTTPTNRKGATALDLVSLFHHRGERQRLYAELFAKYGKKTP